MFFGRGGGPEGDAANTVLSRPAFTAFGAVELV